VIRLCFLAIGLALIPGSLSAELPQPLLWSVFPPGGQRGTEVEVEIRGVDLDGGELWFAHPGIMVRSVRPVATELLPDPEPIPGRFQVRIAADVAPGAYEAFCRGRFGVSNPRLFMVGTAVEQLRPETASTPATPLSVLVPSVVNAQAVAAAVDSYSIDRQAGQQLHLDIWSERLDARMTPLLSVSGPDGTVLATAGRTPAGDPVLDLTAPVTGRYLVQVRDLFAGGGSDWFYRLVVSSTPPVRHVYPPVVVPGQGIDLEVSAGSAAAPGLPGRMPARPRSSWRQLRRLLSPYDIVGDVVDLQAERLAEQSTPVPALATRPPGPVVTAAADPAATRLLTLPATRVGRWSGSNLNHQLEFEAEGGETWIFELFSRRLGEHSDAALLIESISVSESGQQTFKEVAFSDDVAKAFKGLSVDGAGYDPVLSFKVPADGRYRLTASNLDMSGHPAAFVLEARRPRPDFELLAFLASPDRTDINNKMRITTPSLPRGGTTTIDVLLIRRDGFSGVVEVTAEGLTAGLSADPLVIPAKANRGLLVLEAAADAPVAVADIRLIGRGRIGVEPRLQVARAATLRWPVTSRKQPHLVREIGTVRIAVTADTAAYTVTPASRLLKLSAGEKQTVTLAVSRNPESQGPLTLQPSGLPNLLKAGGLTIGEKATEATLEITADATLPAGRYPMMLTGIAKRSFRRFPEAVARAETEHGRLQAIVAELTESRNQQQAALEGRDRQLEAAGKAEAAPADMATIRAERTVVAAELAATEKRLEAATAAATEADKKLKQRQQAAKAKQIEEPITVPVIIVDVVPQATNQVP